MWPIAEFALTDPYRSGQNPEWALSYHPVQSYITCFLNPYGINVHSSAFTLPVLLVSAGIGIACSFRRADKRLGLAVALCTTAILDLARGPASVSYPFLYYHLPFFGAFRGPAKMLPMAFLGIGWFVAHGMDAICRSRRIGMSALVLSAGLALLLHLFQAPSLDEFQQRFTGLTATQAAKYYTMLVYGSTVLFALVWVFHVVCTRGAVVCAATMSAMVYLYARLYAAHTEYFAPLPFPCVSSYHALVPGGVLAPWVLRSFTDFDFQPYLDKHHRLAHVVPREPFPASRLRWEPEDMNRSPLRVRIKSFGPNHLILDVEAPTNGYLLMYQKWTRHWKANVPVVTTTLPCPKMPLMRLSCGKTELVLEYLPHSHIIAALITLLASTALGVWSFAKWGLRWMAWVSGIIGVTIAAVMLMASYGRHSLPPALVVGPVSDTNKFGWQALPASSPQYSLPLRLGLNNKAAPQKPIFRRHESERVRVSFTELVEKAGSSDIRAAHFPLIVLPHSSNALLNVEGFTGRGGTCLQLTNDIYGGVTNITMCFLIKPTTNSVWEVQALAGQYTGYEASNAWRISFLARENAADVFLKLNDSHGTVTWTRLYCAYDRSWWEEWQLLTVVVDIEKYTAVMYLNGLPVAQQRIPPGSMMVRLNVPTYFCSIHGVFPFEGLVREIALYAEAVHDIYRLCELSP